MASPKKILTIEPPPGIVTELTDLDAGFRWVDADKVRFRAGKAEKLRGWVRESDNQFEGKGRGLFGWATLESRRLLAIGTHRRLYASFGGIHYDITPLRASGTYATDPFSVTDTSHTVTVTHTAHGLALGDIIIITDAPVVGGLDLNGEWIVSAINSTSEFEFEHTDPATSTATGGGDVSEYQYLIHIGNEFSQLGFGWGAGVWGESTWGTPRDSSDLLLISQSWSLDNWGEDLVACDWHNKGIYYWEASTGFGQRATLISQAPRSNFILVSDDRRVVAFGSDMGAGTGVDPMIVHWSDAEDYTVWDAASTNTAGAYRLGTGTEIVAAIKSRGEILVWTDAALYSMQTTDPTLVHSFTQLGLGCGVAAPNAYTTYSGRVFWVGQQCRQFYMYDGNIQPLECPVLNHFQNNINPDQIRLLAAGTNMENGEVWFFYPSKASGGEVDSYIIFNALENTWSIGTLDRTAWLDRGYALREAPVALGADGYVYFHEIGNTADGAPIHAYIQSGSWMPDDGNQILFVDRLIPDLDFKKAGPVFVEMGSRLYPSDEFSMKGPYSLTPASRKVDTRLRGREFNIRFESNSVATNWKLGRFRIRAASVARRQ